ncbi:hypothetical protein AGLY_005338 [Aphis glycines]|uniref:Uncharacterized protein n=1 Tax=Aphis glycines TaxID=307491 RepID=A0A6G0TXR6_APHGL|nr:hypothetical protein AGLY_005338 [Aphis glycines]
MKINLKIVILGDSSVGKSSLLVGKFYSDTNLPNYGTNFTTKEIVINGTIVSIQFWDMPGLRSLRSCSVPYYRGADCCVLVYDVTSLESFESLNYWRDDFLTEISIPNGTLCPFVVIGNKVDLNNTMVDQEWVKLWNRDNGILSYFVTSAKDSTNVKEAFNIIVKNAFDYKQKTYIYETVNDQKEQNSRLFCCGLFHVANNLF